MVSRKFFTALGFLVVLLIVSTGSTNPEENEDHAKEADSQGFDAIAQLHKSMDDDRSGSIDLSESTGFLREELHVEDKDRLSRRQKTFHHNNDDSITVDDLWKRWLESEERKWTVEQVVDWLVNSAELPQYAESFVQNKVDGQSLPRLAATNTSYLHTILGVMSSVHRQKLQLKAMDVVLFGYRGPKPSYAKDFLLVALLVLSVGAYWFAVSQKKASQIQAHALTAQLGKLKDMEQEFVDLQNKLEEERVRQESCQASVDGNDMENEELQSLKCQLQEAERQREHRNPLLQSLLRKTYELELSRINQQKLDSLREMNEARELVEKLRKKQSSLLNQIRSVHGSETEEIDERIVSVRQKMEKAARAMEECEQRWVEIEYLMAFKITNSPGTVASRMVGGNALSAFTRPQFYGAPGMEMDNETVPLADATDPRGQFADGTLLRPAFVQQLRQQGSGINLMAAPRLAKPIGVSSSVLSGTLYSDHVGPYRPKFNIDESDMLRSTSSNDLMTDGDVPSSILPINNNNNNTTNSPVTDLPSAARRNQPTPFLAQIGKRPSQGSMGTQSEASAAPNPIKHKKKLFFFGGSRDKKD